jgi:dipeptidyl aminopeptidase/acylaminoacyl peptidase
LLVHGTADTDVPHEQSVLMDRELALQGMPHEFISIPGGGHGLGNIERAQVEEINRRAVAFIGRYTA